MVFAPTYSSLYANLIVETRPLLGSYSHNFQSLHTVLAAQSQIGNRNQEEIDQGNKYSKDEHTSYRCNLRSFVSSSKEHDIALRGVDIIIFQEKDAVDAIFLQCRELDKQSQRTCKRPLEDKVFLPTNLTF